MIKTLLAAVITSMLVMSMDAHADETVVVSCDPSITVTKQGNDAIVNLPGGQIIISDVEGTADEVAMMICLIEAEH